MLRRVRKGEPIVVEKGGTPVAALIDVADLEEYRRLKRASKPALPRVLQEPAPDGRERLLRAAGGWKDIDVDEFMRRIRESRAISTRPVVRLS
jgi:prevent-host-death family protein